MKIRVLFYLTAALLCAVFTSSTRAQCSAFTYQGSLSDAGTPASGSYDLRFALYDDAGAGSQQGDRLTNTAVVVVVVVVVDGVFTVMLDFGVGVFNGSDRWLEIGVVTNGGGAFNTLSPRQLITPSPYAITAGNLNGALPASQLSGTYDTPVTISNAANVFAGHGAGLGNVDAAKLNGLSSSNFWRTSGNADTTSERAPLTARLVGAQTTTSGTIPGHPLSRGATPTTSGLTAITAPSAAPSLQ